MLLHCMQFDLVGEEHLAEQLLGWLLFLFQPFPLFAFLHADVFGLLLTHFQWC